MPEPDDAPDPNRPFEFGLVMAGAISAGAYTGGVIDFLIQALDEWQKAKDERKPDCPPHEVRLKVMAGASAGGMTAGITAGLLNVPFDHVTIFPTQGAANNKLFESWVNRIDIVPLLGDRDLRDTHRPVQSVLDSSVIREIAAAAFTFREAGGPVRRTYLADPLHVLLTVTNLRGVPYTLQLEGDQAARYGMTQHADHMHFTLSPSGARTPNALPLTPNQFDEPNWRVLQDAALATGAFPIGLAPQPLSRAVGEYAGRKWLIPGPFGEDGALHCGERKAIDPSWPRPFDDPTHRYDFLCIDGGTIDNEPLELARHVLTGDEESNPRQPDRATRAILMIDPFPNMTSFRVDDELHLHHNIFSVLMRTSSSLINQARFKPEELELAAMPNVFSRFMIAPTRQDPRTGRDASFAIACGSLGGFGGFLSRSFREHDFHLGRRNCQRFLQRHFVLPSEGPGRNRLFDNWSDTARTQHRVTDEESRAYLPIIPLIGTAAQEVSTAPWPTYRKESLDKLRSMIKDRMQLLVQRLIDDNIEGWFTRRLLSNAWWLKRDEAVDAVMGQIKSDLTRRDLFG